MEEAVAEVERLVRGGCGFTQVIDHLRDLDGFSLTPFNVLHVMREATGIQLHATLDLLRSFDQDLRPTAPVEEIDSAAERYLAAARTTVDAPQEDAGSTGPSAHP